MGTEVGSRQTPSYRCPAQTDVIMRLKGNLPYLLDQECDNLLTEIEILVLGHEEKTLHSAPQTSSINPLYPAGTPGISVCSVEQVSESACKFHGIPFTLLIKATLILFKLCVNAEYLAIYYLNQYRASSKNNGIFI